MNSNSEVPISNAPYLQNRGKTKRLKFLIWKVTRKISLKSSMKAVLVRKVKVGPIDNMTT